MLCRTQGEYQTSAYTYLYTLAMQQNDGACAAVAVQNVSDAVETNDQCLKDMSSKNEKPASQILLAPQCGMQKSDLGKMPSR